MGVKDPQGRPCPTLGCIATITHRHCMNGGCDLYRCTRCGGYGIPGLRWVQGQPSSRKK